MVQVTVPSEKLGKAIYSLPRTMLLTSDHQDVGANDPKGAI